MSRGTLSPLPKGKDGRQCPREAQRPSPTERANLASNWVFEGIVLSLVLVAPLTLQTCILQNTPADSKRAPLAAAGIHTGQLFPERGAQPRRRS